MKIRCLIADDNPENLMFLKALCGKHPDLEIVEAFTDGHSLFSRQGELDYDACFLDIDMPGFDGIELANLLENKAVVFVSGHKNRAAEAFDVEAVDFVSKPINRARFAKAVGKLRHVLQNKRESHDHEGRFEFFPTSKGKTHIDTSKIVAITTPSGEKPDSRDKRMVMSDGRAYLLKNITLNTLLKDNLSSGSFLQVSKRTLINVEQNFTLRSRDTIVFQIPGRHTPLELSLTRSFEKRFKERFPEL